MRSIILFSLLLTLVAFSGCISTPEESSKGEKSMKIIDMAGREIIIPSKVERVVVLNSETMSLMKALKVEAKVVGASAWAFKNPLIPKIYKMDEIQNVGTASKPNVEAIISLKPDLVITYYCGKSEQYAYETPAEDVKKLEEAGIPVIGICVAVTRKADIEEYDQHIRLIGKIFGKENEAEKLVSYLGELRSNLSKMLEKVDRKVKVVYSWSEQNRISGNSTITHTIIELAGGINIGRNISQPYATVNPEFIVESDPDVWIIWRSAKYGPDDIIGNPAYSKIKAVKERRVYKEPEILFSSWEPIIAHLSIYWHAKKYYPDLPFDFEEIQKDVFKKFYGVIT
uniref:ABC transporter substrate-binding protein n=1 Tax=Geoglobus ahangari TaxID=113653 RepID=A0A7C3UC74_9EURY